MSGRRRTRADPAQSLRPEFITACHLRLRGRLSNLPPVSGPRLDAIARRRSPARRPKQRPLLPVGRRVESGPDGFEYEVRAIAASRATKTYRCPGCDHEIRSGTAHLVVWPADLGEQSVDERRHWHTPCWTHRATRSPTRKWS